MAAATLQVFDPDGTVSLEQHTSRQTANCNIDPPAGERWAQVPGCGAASTCTSGTDLPMGQSFLLGAIIVIGPGMAGPLSRLLERLAQGIVIAREPGSDRPV